MKFTSLLILAFSVAGVLGCGADGGSTTPTPIEPNVAISISPATASTLVNQQTQFTATVTNATNTDVTWALQETAGGMISKGLYTAPGTVGTYHVVATSKADPTKSAIAAISVSAVFAFQEEVKDSTVDPFGMTVLLGRFGTDGKFTTSAVNEPSTGEPVTAGIESIALSPDGTKLTFAKMEWNQGSESYYHNIYTANADGTGIANLTNDTSSAYLESPQFSPDGKQIIYTKITPDTHVGQLWAMDSDGSNQHMILSWSADIYVENPTFSPDGTKIAARMDTASADNPNNVVNGIAVMNADGSNVVQLSAAPLDCRDSYPAFTNDGKQIVFSRECYIRTDTASYLNDTLYIMNADGSGLKILYGESDALNALNFDPVPLADRLLFSSNMDNPGTSNMDLYSIKADGSGLTRLTTNTLYDAFNIGLYVFLTPSSSARSLTTRKLSVTTNHFERWRQILQMRGR